VIGPGGTVHSNLGDWATFVAAHVREGRVGLLRPETFRKLHTPAFGGDYAGGWIVTERGWGGGRVLTHAGSNTMNYAVVWAAPSKDFAVMAATNVGGDRAARACDAAAAAMIGRVLKA
jgi:CubicO group peptidase (beta-lactamase class C family)